MFEFSGERYIEARCEQVWMVVDDRTCLSRWLDFPDQVQDVTVYEHSRRVSWNTQEHAVVGEGECANCLTVELIPDGAGTRVRIMATREPSGPIQALAMRMTAQRVFDRHIRRSLEQLAQMLAGRSAG